MKKIETFDLCKHKPSDKYYLVRYCIPDYNLYKDGMTFNNWENNYFNWSLFNDKVGGVFSGKVMLLIAKRFTLKWFLNLYKIL